MMNKINVAVFLQKYGGVLALVVATTATLGSLYYSEIAGFVPCTLCWYQRILMYPLVLITLVGIIEQDDYLPNYVLPFSIIGLGVSGYHVLIQNGVFSHPTTCTVGVPCSLRYVNYMGFVTIPLLAFTAFALITGVMITTRWVYAHYQLADLDIIETEEAMDAVSTQDKAKLVLWIPLGAVIGLAFLFALVAFRSGSSLESVLPVVNSNAPVSAKSLFEQTTIGNAPGCIACHSLQPDVVVVGPSVAGIATKAGDRVTGQSASEYLREAIVDPNAFIVAEFSEGIMYQNYGEDLTEDQIDDLVSFLLFLTE